MKKSSIVLLVVGGLVVLLGGAFGIFLLANIQGVVKPFEVNQPNPEKKLLIASQGSEFKEALVKSVVDRLRDEPVGIKVIDVTSLPGVKEEEWDAVILLHTTESWKLQGDVQAYLERAKNLDKVILISTSGSGEWKTDKFKIDTLTSASKTAEIGPLPERILARLKSILKGGKLD